MSGIPPTLDAVYGKITAVNDRFDRGWRSEDLRFLTNALAGEAGELCNSAKHLYGGGTHRVVVTSRDLLDEAADVFVYLAMVVENVRDRWRTHHLTDIVPDFAEIINAKMDEVRKRFETGMVGDR